MPNATVRTVRTEQPVHWEALGLKKGPRESRDVRGAGDGEEAGSEWHRGWKELFCQNHERPWSVSRCWRIEESWGFQ